MIPQDRPVAITSVERSLFTVCAGVQVLLLLRQMEATNTQSTATKLSLLMLGQQAVMDAYLCLLHLTTGTVNAPHKDI